MTPTIRVSHCGVRSGFAWPAALLLGVCAMTHGADAQSPGASWSADEGVVWRAGQWKVLLDRNAQERGPLLRVGGQSLTIGAPRIDKGQEALTLTSEVTGPGGVRIALSRRIEWHMRDGNHDLVETFEIRPSAPIREVLEVARPFTIHPARAFATFPLRDGRAKKYPLPAEGEYRLCHSIAPKAVELALPVVAMTGDGFAGAVCADPRFSADFFMRQKGDGVEGEIRHAYDGGRVPLQGAEMRRFGFWLRHQPTAEAFDAAMDSFFRLAMPDVPPGPGWLKEIAMVGYDYLSDNGQGWERDVTALAETLTPAERSRVALCFHGWYDALGRYCYDHGARAMKKEWVAMARTRKVALTQEEVRRRLRLAKGKGFRVLMYFADGLLADTAIPDYNAEWEYRNPNDDAVRGWTGPDTWGATHARNPAHPGVVAWYSGYLDALLRTWGKDVDGWVWDETFHIRTGAWTQKPVPAYCDRAMMDLVKSLAAKVHAFDSSKAFLVSDINAAPYAVMAHGTYQDSHCNPDAWPGAMFPNWRNTCWSCAWEPISKFPWQVIGVERYRTPVAISNGWGEDRGSSEWTGEQREKVLELFRKRIQMPPGQVRYLREP